MLPAIMAIIDEVFSAAPDSVQYLGSSAFNQTARVEVRGVAYFVKWNVDATPGFFTAEAHGLEVLARSGAIRTPAVIGVGERGTNSGSYLVLEWIDQTTESPQFGEKLGQAVAQLHHKTEQRFGLGSDNFIGALPQFNTSTVRWPDFYRDQRIMPQMHLARQNGYLSATRESLLNQIVEQMDDLLADLQPMSSLLHGDLWSGNFLAAAGDQPVLIDPAVYYGDREVEIAFTELFGGFPSRFLEAYREAYPLDAGYERRRALYHLYPMLVHLNLFGESYGSRVDAICRQYVKTRQSA
jgi:fructosamine-3-kinase